MPTREDNDAVRTSHSWTLRKPLRNNRQRFVLSGRRNVHENWSSPALGELRGLSSGSALDRRRSYADCSRVIGARTWRPMLFKLFRKPPDLRPRFEQDTSLADELARRVNSIEFQPSKGFLKDQRQLKRSASPQRAPATQK